ncbi:large-conductance mechanosensitive channel protein MscL [Oceanivirga salmonicida]|uniref:large-conductance mechanosensitive channel protein MscL n=1 Tax=Oceanivirga salmonicida TaxID=1769291 RepID=UPI000831ADAD|nr:large-conductance mechanosensitive channel protein MscL [Oceanivirga salmonicida]
MFKEFKAFIAKGSVVELAVGVIIGGAFGKIVASLVNDILNPVIGIVLGGTDLTNLKIVLKAAEGEIPESAIMYGSFIQAIINFIIIAFVIFIFVKSYNKMKEKDEKKEEAPKAPVLTMDQELLKEIRDLMKK